MKGFSLREKKEMAMMRKRVILGLIFLGIFCVAPGLSLERAYNPWPPDGSTGVSIYTDLAWDHDGNSSSLYFGTDMDRLYRLLERSYSSHYDFYDNLRLGDRYYWRVDVHYGDETVTGQLWTFRTESSFWGLGFATGCNSAFPGSLIFLVILLPLLMSHKDFKTRANRRESTGKNQNL